MSVYTEARGSKMMWDGDGDDVTLYLHIYENALFCSVIWLIAGRNWRSGGEGAIVVKKKKSHITIFNRGSCTTSIIKWISQSRGETYMMCILIDSTLPLSDRIFIFEQTASALGISNLGHLGQVFLLNVSTVTGLENIRRILKNIFL